MQPGRVLQKPRGQRWGTSWAWMAPLIILRFRVPHHSLGTFRSVPLQPQGRLLRPARVGISRAPSWTLEGRGLTGAGACRTQNWGVKLPYPVWSRPIREGGSRDQRAVSPPPPRPCADTISSSPRGDVLLLFRKRSILFGPFCVEIVWCDICVVTGLVLAP